MFFKDRYLNKGGRFHDVWLAAHHLEKFKMDQEYFIDVCLDLAQLLHPSPLAAATGRAPSLRLASHLLYGTARHHAALTDQLLQDTQELLQEMNISRHPDKHFYDIILEEHYGNDNSDSLSEESIQNELRQIITTSSPSINENRRNITRTSFILEFNDNRNRDFDTNKKSNLKSPQPRSNRADVRLDDTDTFLALENLISNHALPERKDVSTSTTTLNNLRSPGINTSDRTGNFETAAEFLETIPYRSQSCPNSPLRDTSIKSPIIKLSNEIGKQRFTDAIDVGDSARRPDAQTDVVVVNDSDAAIDSNSNRRRSSNSDIEDEPVSKVARTDSSYQICFLSPLNNENSSKNPEEDKSSSYNTIEISPDNQGDNQGSVNDETEIENDQRMLQTLSTQSRTVTKSPSDKRREQKKAASLPYKVRGVSTAPITRRRRRRPATVYRSRKDLAAVEKAFIEVIRIRRNMSKEIARTIHAANSEIEDQQIRGENRVSSVDTSVYEVPDNIDTPTPPPIQSSVQISSPISGKEDDRFDQLRRESVESIQNLVRISSPTCGTEEDIFDRIRQESVEAISCVTPPSFPDNSEYFDENLERNSHENSKSNADYNIKRNIHDNTTTMFENDRISLPRSRIIETVAQLCSRENKDDDRIFITLPPYKPRCKHPNIRSNIRRCVRRNLIEKKIKEPHRHFSNMQEVISNAVDEELSSTYTTSEGELNPSDEEIDIENIDIPSSYNAGHKKSPEPILKTADLLKSMYGYSTNTTSKRELNFRDEEIGIEDMDTLSSHNPENRTSLEPIIIETTKPFKSTHVPDILMKSDSGQNEIDENIDTPPSYNSGLRISLETILETTEPLESTQVRETEELVLRNEPNSNTSDDESANNMELDENMLQDEIEMVLSQPLPSDIEANSESVQGEINSDSQTNSTDVEDSFDNASVSSLGLDAVTFVFKRHGPVFPPLVLRYKISEIPELNEYVLQKWGHRFQ